MYAKQQAIRGGCPSVSPGSAVTGTNDVSAPLIDVSTPTRGLVHEVLTRLAGSGCRSLTQLSPFQVVTMVV